MLGQQMQDYIPDAGEGDLEKSVYNLTGALT